MRGPLFAPALVLASLAAAPAGGTETGSLLPVPARVEWRAGRLVVGASFSTAVAGRCDARLRPYLGRVLRRLEGRTGLVFSRADTTAPADASLFVTCREAGAPVPALGEDESYVLEVGEAQARLEAVTTVGALRGLETLLQLIAADGGEYFLPVVRVEDRPRFPWRGLLVDVARHFVPLEVLRRTIDGMAAVKLNVLHLHLTEDQGFRIESRRYPRLHTMGSDGLYYRQDDIRALVDYAGQRGIRVVPEFDMPGHTTSWLVGYPELASAPGPYQIERRWGIFDPTLDPTRKDVYRFLDRLVGEMATLFPDAYVHIGGDEVTGKHWAASPKIQAYIREKRLGDTHGLQAHFNQRVNAILRKHGRRMIGWNEVLHPELPSDMVVQSWKGQAPLQASVRAGHGGILSQGYYLDLLSPASAHYAADPLPEGHGLSADQAARVLGGEACLWTEYMDADTLESRLWPRLAAIAERLWSPREVQAADDLYRRLEIVSLQLEELGLAHEKNYDMLLRRLAGGRPHGPLRELVDLLEPRITLRRRAQPRPTQFSPLTRLPDAARPDSRAARLFVADVDALLADAPRFAARRDAILATLTSWSGVAASVGPVLTGSPMLQDAASFAPDLAEAAAAARDAVERLAEADGAEQAAPDAEWRDERLAVLSRAARPRAETELAVVPALRKLVVAASERAYLRETGPAAWPAWVSKRTAELVPKPAR